MAIPNNLEFNDTRIILVNTFRLFHITYKTNIGINIPYEYRISYITLFKRIFIIGKYVQNAVAIIINPAIMIILILFKFADIMYICIMVSV